MVSETGEFYYQEADKAVGPFSREKFIKLAQDGYIEASTMISLDGVNDWKSLESLEDIYSEVKASRQQPNQDDAKGSAVDFCLSQIDRITGLPRLKAVPWNRVWSSVFTKHHDHEVDAIFTPEKSTGATPWFFSRVLLFGLLGNLVLLWGFARFGNFLLAPGFMFFACVTVPFATLAFLIELCGLRDLSSWRICKAIFFGGVASLIITLFLHEMVPELGLLLGASIAGPVEESAKLMAAIWIARSWSQSRNIRSGILTGAAVGVGFAVFETAGYIFQVLIHGSIGDLFHVMLLRAILAPFGHVIWTALAVGALWRVSTMDDRLTKAHFTDRNFLRFFGLAVVLHMIWNASFGVPLLGGIAAYLAKFILLGFVGWYALLQLYSIKDTPPASQSE